jgi:putative membrane protein
MVEVVGYSLNVHLLFFVLFAIPFSLILVSIFVVSLNRVGRRIMGVPTLSLLRAFLADWLEGLNAPLESILLRFGREQNVKASILAFRWNKSLKALMVVPAIHPGPFKNVGSSILPHLIQTALEDSFQCAAFVPHGMCGHEMDLASQLQNQKVVEGILSSMDFSAFESEATPFIRTRVNGANASCQIFGKCALFTLTFAPQTTEDLPSNLGSTLINEAVKRGLSSAIIVDAHNSIDGPFEDEKSIDSLRRAAVKALEMAVLHHRFPFEVGIAKVVPEEFGVREGLGPGGISVLVVQVGGQKTAYITIDGNNMVSGLRERILLNLRELGIDGGEVLTTDTHVVSGVALTKRGYHPVGEAMDQGRLIGYIRKGSATASNNLEPTETSWSTVTISGVKTIGEKQLGDLSLLTDEAVKISKRLALSIFSVAGLLLTLLLLL